METELRHGKDMSWHSTAQTGKPRKTKKEEKENRDRLGGRIFRRAGNGFSSALDQTPLLIRRLKSSRQNSTRNFPVSA